MLPSNGTVPNAEAVDEMLRPPNAESDVPRETQAYLLEAALQSPDGLLLIDRAWRLVFANEQGRRISRLRPEDLNGRVFWEKYPDVIGTEVERRYRRAMEERVAEEFEYFYETFDTWYRIRVRPVGMGIAVYLTDITELRVAQKKRDQAGAQLEEVLEATTDGVFSLDREWRFTYVNSRAELLTGPSAELLGTSLWNRFPGTVYEGSPFVRFYFRAMHEREPGRFTAFYPEPLNVWLDVEARPAENGIIVFFRDVTQQHKDEQALRESEERYRVLTELGPQAIWTGTPDGRITYANQRFLEYIGSHFEPKDGTEWMGAFFKEDRNRVVERWLDSVKSGEDYAMEARLVRAVDGAVRWWRLRALPLRDQAGAITMWLGVADDIHEERTAAERLRLEREETDRERRELEAVYDTAPVGLALYEPTDFRFLRVNARLAETIGMGGEEILGRRIQDVATTAVVPELFQKVLRGETVRDQTFSTEFHNRPGEVRQFNVNYSPVFGPDGKVRAISSAVLEITQLRKAEAALVQSEKLAAVGRLAASISHEINNPLESVTNLLYLTANDSGLSEETLGFVRMAQDELARVSQIATQTLRFHRQADRPTEVTAAQLVDPVLNLYQGRLVNSGITVEASYATARTVLCFENDIRQVLNNLIANAIDAMRTGGRLRIRAHAAFDLRSETEGVRISVADTGHGMGSETSKRVFDPFYTTKGLNGNGLGLWISRGIVERHQGQLRVRSSQGGALHGTVFSLFLPSVQGPVPSI